MPKPSRKSKYWTPAVIQYIVDHYMGTTAGKKGQARRNFMWEAGEDILEGNTAAFTDHLCKHFGIPQSKWSWTYVDTLLVEQDKRVKAFQSRPGERGSPTAFQEPESEVVGKAKKHVIAEFLVRVYSDGTREVLDR